MQIKTYFEKSLCESAGLFSLQKKQADLFLLSQTGLITYRQLALCNLHGKTETAGRLSLKTLEKDGLIQSRKLPNQHQNKYYFLTPKGRSILKSLFPPILLEYLQISLEKRLPAGTQQIYHRIRANDFYFVYIGSPKSHPVPWILEYPLKPLASPGKEAEPRCDGILITPHTKYYIEQDNNTQSENVILQKLQHYRQAGILRENETGNILIFCLAFPHKRSLTAKPSFSLYRVLLHFTKIWSIFEEDCKVPLDYRQFLQVLECSALKRTISANEIQVFQSLHSRHPEMDSLADVYTLKKMYLDDTSYSDMQDLDMDELFQKRVHSHFRRVYSEHPSLVSHALNGNPIFTVPNHRLPLYQPYIMPYEYDFPEQLLKCLLFNGLNTDGWEYQHPLRIIRQDQTELRFFQGFCHKKYGYIACEHLTIDLSSRIRIQKYFQSGTDAKTPVFLLLFSSVQNLADIESHCKTPGKNTTVLMIDCSRPLHLNPPPAIFLADGSKLPVIFECDEFDGQLRIVTRKETC